ncbi:MAG: homoserine kinase [Eubacterium sp.]|nr:homoserine kinase [Eubacterium sp.]
MIRVRVPATSANIGPGFDAFGMAFELYNIFSFEERDTGKLTIRGVAKKYQGKSNLVYKAMLKVFNKVGYKPKGLYIYSDVNVPVSRGLGSSATCIVGGLVGANVLCGAPLTGQELFDLAVEMEGHPDNVAPAMFGGLVVSIGTREENFYIKKPVAPQFDFYAAIPDFTLPTIEARRAIPKKIYHKDAAFNVSRASMTYLALADGLPDILKESMKDKLHQPYRIPLIDHYDEVHSTAEGFGALGSCISGAGPTILIVCDKKNHRFEAEMSRWMAETLPQWQFLKLIPDNTGVCTDQHS